VDLSSKRILVTGADGFIGSHLVEHLVGLGADVRAFVYYNSFNSWGWLDNSPEHVKKSIDVFAGDIRDPNGVRTAMQDCDVVMHLAALIAIPFSYHSPDSYVDTNVKGTLNVVQAARDLGTERVVHTSTSEVYGEPSQHPQHETDLGRVDAGNARACYAEGKRAAETLCFDFAREHGVDVRVARLFNTYGPRMALDDGRVVSNFLVQALRGEPLTIHGDGQQTRSFCYVTDLVEGMLAFAQRDLRTHGPINLGNPEELSVLDLATRVLRLVGSPSTLTHHAATAGDPRMRRPDIDRARELFGFAPATSLDLGLRLTLEDLRPRTTQRDAA